MFAVVIFQKHKYAELSHQITIDIIRLLPKHLVQHALYLLRDPVGPVILCGFVLQVVKLLVLFWYFAMAHESFVWHDCLFTTEFLYLFAVFRYHVRVLAGFVDGLWLLGNLRCNTARIEIAFLFHNAFNWNEFNIWRCCDLHWWTVFMVGYKYMFSNSKMLFLDGS